MPEGPGVYFWWRGKTILYIGKATVLRDRVKSYFAKDLIESRGLRLVEMVEQSEQITWQETDSVLEALILEANLIKQHQPKYNILEKDDKSWNYMLISDEVLPKILIEREKNIDFAKKQIKNKTGHHGNIATDKALKQPKESSQGIENGAGLKISHFFGPFTNGAALKEALKIIRRIFPFIDERSAKKNNNEFYRQLGLTPETQSVENRKKYLETIKKIKLFFEAKKKTVIYDLEKEMMLLAKQEKFEAANKIKKQIFALQHIHDISLLKRDKKNNQQLRIEAYDVAHLAGENQVGVMTVIENGEINKNEYRKFNIKTQTRANDLQALQEILSRRLSHSEWSLPDLIVVDGNEMQLGVAKKVLQKMQLSAIKVVAVVKDNRHKAREILGDKNSIKKFKSEILLANNEAHRFAIKFHRQRRDKIIL